MIPFQSSTLLIENYSQNQCHYLQNQCLKYDLIKDRRNRQKQKKFFPSSIESPIFNTNPNNIKLQMLHEGLKCKQLEEKNTIYVIQRELQINNHKVDNGLNEAFIRGLASERTLRDLIKTTSGYNGADRFLTLLSGKMKIGENLILVEHRELH